VVVFVEIGSGRQMVESVDSALDGGPALEDLHNKIIGTKVGCGIVERALEIAKIFTFKLNYLSWSPSEGHILRKPGIRK